MISRKISSGCANSGIPPGAVLVVVLHAEHDARALGVLERPADAVDGARDAFVARHAGIPLAAERAAVPRAQPDGEIDRRLLPLDLALPFRRIGMGEVGREADHRGDLPGLVHRAHDRVDVGGIEAAEKPVVVLDPLAAERGRVVRSTARTIACVR